MYVLLIFLSFFTLNKSFADSFEESLAHRWKGIHDVKINRKIKPSLPIDEPVGTNLKILEVYINGANFKPLKDCVFYQVPNAKKTGVLYLHRLQINEDCNDYILNMETEKKQEIYNFAFELKENKLQLFIDSQTLEFPTQKKSIFEVSTTNIISRFELKNQDHCYQVDDKCKVVMKNRCDLCPKSFINVIETNCQTDYSKICVDHSCGNKNQPACIRGWKASQLKLDFCIADSPVGFCNPGLRVFCEAGRLVCK